MHQAVREAALEVRVECQPATSSQVARPLPEAEEATGEDSAEGKDASDEVARLNLRELPRRSPCANLPIWQVDIPPEVLELFGTLRGEAIRRACRSTKRLHCAFVLQVLLKAVIICRPSKP